jgi:predicted enzyme related to lactoylglutathione lyase
MAPTNSASELPILNADGAIDAMLERIVAAGGEIITPATPIPPTGQIAVFRDSEGNRIGLHQS